MKFTGSDTVEAHLHNLFTSEASARSAQLSPSLARRGGRIAILGWNYVTDPTNPRFLRFLFGLPTGCGR